MEWQYLAFPNESIRDAVQSISRHYQLCLIDSLNIFNAFIYTIYQALRSGRIWHKVNFKRSLTGLNSEFSFS